MDTLPNDHIDGASRKLNNVKVRDELQSGEGRIIIALHSQHKKLGGPPAIFQETFDTYKKVEKLEYSFVGKNIECVSSDWIHYG